jgi:hypothetical protein
MAGGRVLEGRPQAGTRANATTIPAPETLTMALGAPTDSPTTESSAKATPVMARPVGISPPSASVHDGRDRDLLPGHPMTIYRNIRTRQPAGTDE